MAYLVEVWRHRDFLDEASTYDLASAADLTCAGRLWLNMNLIPEEVWRDTVFLEDGSHEYVYPVDVIHYKGNFQADVKALGIGYWNAKTENIFLAPLHHMINEEKVLVQVPEEQASPLLRVVDFRRHERVPTREAELGRTYAYAPPALTIDKNI